MAADPRHGPAPDLWDPLVRTSHWGIALVVLANAVFTKGGGSVHVAIGWIGIALLVLRLAWGLVGAPEARFGAFPPQPRAAIAHLRSLWSGKPGHYRSHNPAGAMMVYALWISLAVVIATGLAMTTDSPATIADREAIVTSGDWSTLAGTSDAGDDDAQDEHARKWVKEVHEMAANLMLALAALHVAGVMVESRALRRNLVMPMIFGRRK